MIGDSAYQKTIAPPKPVHDAGTIGALFRVMGFDVVEAKFDLGIADLRHALRKFSDHVHEADIAVVYYAGHGRRCGSRGLRRQRSRSLRSSR